MPRLAKKLTRKIAAPRSTLRQVRAKKKSDMNSNTTMQFAARAQDRSEQFKHYLFRYAFEIEIRLFRHFPEFIKATRAGAFESKHLDQQVQHVGSFDQPSLKALTPFVVVIESCVGAVSIYRADDV